MSFYVGRDPRYVGESSLHVVTLTLTLKGKCNGAAFIFELADFYLQCSLKAVK